MFGQISQRLLSQAEEEMDGDIAFSQNSNEQ